MLLNVFLGVSTTSPKKSSSLNMSPSSVIIFIKCRNRHHMKNNIRYKGNINSTSVIIFFNWRTKIPSDVTLLGRTTIEVFVMLVVVVHSFLFFFLLLFFIHFYSSFCCCSSFIAFQRHLSPFRGLSPGFTPILNFQPSSSQSDLRHFHFQPFQDLLVTVLLRALQF